MDEERLVDIESRLTFHERAMKELNEVVYEQRKEIDALKKSVAQLSSRVPEATEDDLGDVHDETPPHY